MREQIQAVRNNLIIKAWEENKNMMMMSELAEMFGITLQHAYRILKAEAKIKQMVGQNKSKTIK